MTRMFKHIVLWAAAVGWMILAAATGTYAQEQYEPENSWRYRDGVPIYDDNVPELLWSDLCSEEAVPYNSYRAEDPAARNTIQHYGIDVSYHQGKIDWQRVKDSGVEFAILRCGIGSEYDGVGENKQDDAYWEYNASECERLGIPYGVYLYSYATNAEMAASEARHTLNLLTGHHPQLPVFLDLEQLDSNDRPIASNEMFGTIAQTWCDMVSAAGYRVGIYSYTSFFNNYLTDPRFENPNWYRWVADYTGSCTYKGRYEMWQSSNKGIIPGIDSYVDTNTWYGTYPPTSMFRLYNPNSGEHFYTGSEEEMGYLASLGWQYEGIAWNAPVDSGTPVHRLCNPNTGDHHYTMSLEEVEMLRAAGWIYEGVAWNSDGTVPQYRLYNPNAQTGIHHYTSSTQERDHLASLGWRTEGIGWYGMS